MKIIEESKYGLYLWEMPNGQLVSDGDGNYLNVAAFKGDIAKLNMIIKAAAYYQVSEGRPVFHAGHRRVTDDEYNDQIANLIDGVNPDPYDIPAVIEDAENARR